VRSEADKCGVAPFCSTARLGADRRNPYEEVTVIVVRFKLRCSPDKAEEIRALLAAVQSASQAVPGVITFDIGRDLLDADAFIATEVFNDRAALNRQEALPEVAAATAEFDGALVAPP
jgi:quinol monooxygenase YgiN